MKREEREPLDRAAALRAEFDRSFATEPTRRLLEVDNFLGIRMSGDAYAVRLAEVAGLFSDRKILTLPSPVPELLGLTGLRGVVLPIYSLAALLGYPVKAGAARWLVVAGSDHQIGLAFEHFEGHLQIARAELGKTAADARSHVRETARFGDELRAIVSIPSIMAEVAQRAGANRLGKEH